MTRIISGKARSLTLQVPKSGTRPTSDRIREAVFSTLESWDAVDGARVLDLFAGTGALGIEAASRGARKVTLLEKHPPAAEILRKNVAAAKRFLQNENETPSLTVLRGSANAFFDDKNDGAEWDLIFIDPPYDFSDSALNTILEDAAENMSAEAVVMVERSSRSNPPVWPDSLEEIRSKKYGDTTIWWAEKLLG